MLHTLLLLITRKDPALLHIHPHTHVPSDPLSHTSSIITKELNRNNLAPPVLLQVGYLMKPGRVFVWSLLRWHAWLGLALKLGWKGKDKSSPRRQYWDYVLPRWSMMSNKNPETVVWSNIHIPITFCALHFQRGRATTTTRRGGGRICRKFMNLRSNFSGALG